MYRRHPANTPATKAATRINEVHNSSEPFWLIPLSIANRVNCGTAILPTDHDSPTVTPPRSPRRWATNVSRRSFQPSFVAPLGDSSDICWGEVTYVLMGTKNELHPNALIRDQKA